VLKKKFYSHDQAAEPLREALAALDDLKRERDEARAEVERLRAAIQRHREGVEDGSVSRSNIELWAALEVTK
jgi:uncharacterized coiled-coil DUF342 family protein